MNNLEVGSMPWLLTKFGIVRIFKHIIHLDNFPFLYSQESSKEKLYLTWYLLNSFNIFIFEKCYDRPNFNFDTQVHHHIKIKSNVKLWLRKGLVLKYRSFNNYISVIHYTITEYRCSHIRVGQSPNILLNL